MNTREYTRRALETYTLIRIKCILQQQSYSKTNIRPLDIDHESLKKIIHQLGNLPLALEQAGAYIYRRQYSFTRYLQDFETSITHVFNTGSNQIGNRNRSVFAAWELSFKAIQKENPAAADLLLLCGYLDNRDIPEALLQKGLGLPAHGKILFPTNNLPPVKNRINVLQMWAWPLQ